MQRPNNIGTTAGKRQKETCERGKTWVSDAKNRLKREKGHSWWDSLTGAAGNFTWLTSRLVHPPVVQHCLPSSLLFYWQHEEGGLFWTLWQKVALSSKEVQQTVSKRVWSTAAGRLGKKVRGWIILCCSCQRLNSKNLNCWGNYKI